MFLSLGLGNATERQRRRHVKSPALSSMPVLCPRSLNTALHSSFIYFTAPTMLALNILDLFMRVVHPCISDVSNPVECFESHPGWWRSVDALGNAAPLASLFVSLGRCSSMSTLPSPLPADTLITFCPFVSLVPRRCIELVESQCCNISSNQSSQYNAHCYFAVLYEHTLINITMEQEVLCIVNRTMLFCEFDVFQEMGRASPSSGIVLISQISGRNKSQNFPMLIHRACCYLVLFTVRLLSYCLLLLLLLTFYCIYNLLCVSTTPTQGHGTLLSSWGRDD